MESKTEIKIIEGKRVTDFVKENPVVFGTLIGYYQHVHKFDWSEFLEGTTLAISEMSSK